MTPQDRHHDSDFLRKPLRRGRPWLGKNNGFTKIRDFPQIPWGFFRNRRGDRHAPLLATESTSSGSQGSATKATQEPPEGDAQALRARPLHPRRRPRGPPRTPRGAQGASGAPPRRQNSEFYLGKTCIPAFRPKTVHGPSWNVPFGEGTAPEGSVGERRRCRKSVGTSKA